MKTHRTSTRASLLAALAAAAVGCDPQIPLPESSLSSNPDGGAGGSSGTGGGASIVVSVEPAAPIDAAPRVLRLRAELPGLTLDPTRFALVQGTLGPRQAREFYDGNVSATLSQQIVETLSWNDGDAETLAPTAPLQTGATYTLVVADVAAVVSVQVAASDSVPLLERVWPPDGASGTAAFAVWCGDDVVPRVDMAAAPAPDGPAGRMYRGALTAGAGESCVRFEAEAADAGAGVVAVPPPIIASADDPTVVMRLDPRPLRVDGPPAPPAAVACDPGEVPFGPGCATLLDDRLYGRSPAVPLLWAVAGAGVDSVFAAGPGDPFVIAGLPPATDVALDVAAIDTGGAVLRTLFAATTLPPSPHVAINEVLAHPLGPEPAQEWVEIVNDGPAPAVLDGYVLIVGSGSTPLPAAMLPPGAFALIVNQEYMAMGGPDVVPAPGTLFLTVPHLGKQGLSDEGETLALLDNDGNTISSFPAKPRPVQGSSVARRTPSAPDALPGSFSLAVPSPGRTNTW
jgi:Lamin Tail Domain